MYSANFILRGTRTYVDREQDLRNSKVQHVLTMDGGTDGTKYSVPSEAPGRRGSGEGRRGHSGVWESGANDRAMTNLVNFGPPSWNGSRYRRSENGVVKCHPSHVPQKWMNFGPLATKFSYLMFTHPKSTSLLQRSAWKICKS